MVGGGSIIHNRFFIHNVGFDFAIALKELDDEHVNELVEIVEKQINNAKRMLKVFRNKNKAKKYYVEITIE